MTLRINEMQKLQKYLLSPTSNKAWKQAWLQTLNSNRILILRVGATTKNHELIYLIGTYWSEEESEKERERERKRKSEIPIENRWANDCQLKIKCIVWVRSSTVRQTNNQTNGTVFLRVEYVDKIERMKCAARLQPKYGLFICSMHFSTAPNVNLNVK